MIRMRHALVLLALLPLDGAQGNSVALVWSVPAQQSEEWLAADPQALAQAVQGRGPAVGLGRIIQVSAHPRGLIFHARIQGVFRRQAGNRVRARGPGAGQVFQAERDHGRQRRARRAEPRG